MESQTCSPLHFQGCSLVIEDVVFAGFLPNVFEMTSAVATSSQNGPCGTGVSNIPRSLPELPMTLHKLVFQETESWCDLQGRKSNFTNSKTLVGWLVDVATDRPARYLRPARMSINSKKTKNDETQEKKSKKKENEKKCK